MNTSVNNSVGTCYEDAWRFLIKEEEGELIHGTVESLGRRIGHAWVELPTGFIWEPESRQFIKKTDFKAMAKPQEEARYSVTEAAIMLARVGKHGPWTREEKEEFLRARGNPNFQTRKQLEDKRAMEQASRLYWPKEVTMPRTEEERKSIHERIFGKGAPLERLGRGQTVNNLLPMLPEEGPPLPRIIALKWPWRK